MDDKVEGMDRELYRTTMGTPPDEMEAERRRLKESCKTYLGDAVYAKYDGRGIWLYTTDGITPEIDKIYLEDFVLRALIVFAKRAGMVCEL